MTPREHFIAALERRPVTGRVPHFELDYYLTMEVFGQVHPNHRIFGQWDQMSENERRLHRESVADLHIEIAERFEHSAIFLRTAPGTVEEMMRVIDIVRDKTGDRYFLLIHGDATHAIPDGNEMIAFSRKLIQRPAELKAEAERMIAERLDEQERLARHGGLDGLALCADYCFNDGPFLSPAKFAEFVAPYLKKLIAAQRELGYYVIKHTDGDIMPILDQLVDCNPHALHSLDPQAGVDIAEVKRLVGDRVCLCGNVNCALLDTGTDEEVIESARYALKHGMPGGGYIYCSSNCVYTGMPPERYELMLRVWREEGWYDAADPQPAETGRDGVS